MELSHKRACKFYWFNEQIVFLIVIVTLQPSNCQANAKVQVAFE